MAYLKSLIFILTALYYLLHEGSAEHGKFGKRVRSRDARGVEQLQRQREEALKSRQDSKSSYRFYNDQTKGRFGLLFIKQLDHKLR
jgi:hypothetical protein